MADSIEQWVRLISEETVLCHDGTRFLAYSISDLPITSKPPSASTYPSPSPTCTAICGTSLMSGPFYVHDSTRFLCVVSPGLEGVIIQENPLRIEVLKLRSESMYSAQQTGYRHALGFHEESSSMAKVSWPEHAADDTCISKTRFKRFGCTAVSFLDEVSGRAVIARLGNPPFELVEFGVWFFGCYTCRFVMYTDLKAALFQVRSFWNLDDCTEISCKPILRIEGWYYALAGKRPDPLLDQLVVFSVVFIRPNVRMQKIIAVLKCCLVWLNTPFIIIEEYVILYSPTELHSISQFIQKGWLRIIVRLCLTW